MGRSAAESRRLQLQGMIYAEHTELLLRMAGVRPGTHVLDVGCGAGDVTLQLAELVGPTGSVLGIDSDPGVLAVARRRAEEGGVATVRFEQTNVLDVQLDQPVDAVVGRLILIHLDDPVAAVRHLASFVRPGGLVSFQDFNLSRARAVPPVPVFTRSVEWVINGLVAAGRPVDPGERMSAILRDAGLPAPRMLALGPASADPESPYYDLVAATAASLLPLIETTGVPAAEVGVETLAQRLRAEAVAAGSTGYLPELVGAWTHRPER
ncbi:class I SAM-dependent methyltransferase [Amycolatopsis bartoniae]|nr:class I SAM-dependent methyltransferase [Amycolatopsis bartoniae]